MAETPYCPLLSIGKDIPVKCQEELCMFYVKQLKLCSITVIGYANALGIQAPSGVQMQPKKSSPQEKPASEPKKPGQDPVANPFTLDDLE